MNARRRAATAGYWFDNGLQLEGWFIAMDVEEAGSSGREESCVLLPVK